MNGIELSVQKPVLSCSINVSQGRDEWTMTANRYRVPFRGDENALQLDCGDVYTILNRIKATGLCALNG